MAHKLNYIDYFIISVVACVLIGLSIGYRAYRNAPKGLKLETKIIVYQEGEIIADSHYYIPKNCPLCGEFHKIAIKKGSEPPQVLTHKCNNCGNQVNFIDKRIPKTEATALIELLKHYIRLREEMRP